MVACKSFLSNKFHRTFSPFSAMSNKRRLFFMKTLCRYQNRFYRSKRSNYFPKFVWGRNLY